VSEPQPPDDAAVALVAAAQQRSAGLYATPDGVQSLQAAHLGAQPEPLADQDG
jgi:hypothetical protein